MGTRNSFQSPLGFLLSLALVALFAGAAARAEEGTSPKKSPRVVYPKKTELDFEGAAIEGEIRNPGELYFQRRSEEKFDSLVKPRKNFHPEMIRDVLQTR